MFLPPRGIRRAAGGIAGLLGAALVLAVLVAPSAQAVDPIPVVHTEITQVGLYTIQVSFTDWPIYAGKSLDFTFLPQDGIAGHSGDLEMIAPSGTEYQSGRHGTGRKLVRYTREQDRWGLDTYLLPDQGTWRFAFTVDGPAGRGSGALAVPVQPRQGPSLLVSWIIALLPAYVAIGVGVLCWVRGRRTCTIEPWMWD